MMTGESAAAFRDSLHTSGLAVDVEEHARVAMLIPRDATSLLAFAAPAVRRDAMRLAAQHGFTHAAIELTPQLFEQPNAATVRRD